jgi:hypothetical protein
LYFCWQSKITVGNFDTRRNNPRFLERGNIRELGHGQGHELA